LDREAVYFVWIGLILYFLRERILNRLFKLCNVVSKVFKFFIRCLDKGKELKRYKQKSQVFKIVLESLQSGPDRVIGKIGIYLSFFEECDLKFVVHAVCLAL
jgi:hypothetical protein